VAREHRHEHLVPSLRPLDEHRGDDRHQDPGERQSPVLRPAILGVDPLDPVREQRVEVLAEQLALVRPAVVDL
jgi:hypothetical protein